MDEDGLSVEVREVGGSGSVLRGEGVEIETGDVVVFHGDHRMMAAIAEHLEAMGEDDEPPIAFVPFWAIQSRVAA